MPGKIRVLTSLMTLVIVLIVVVALQSYERESRVQADSGRFDYVQVVSPMYLYRGNQGVLLLDKRNGNIWFIGKGSDLNLTFHDPVFVSRLPLEKLDQAPH